MAEDLRISHGSREEKYQVLVPQIAALIQSESDPIANLANVAAAIHQTFSFLWTGFYLVKGNELVLGPFQGPVACTRISHAKGVCGKCWELAEAIIVPDVEKFPGHIACSSLSRSEIVIPVKIAGQVVAVLDVDSENLNEFDETDLQYLTRIVDLIRL